MNDVVTRKPVVRGAAVATALLAVLPVLSGCGIGKSNETERSQTTITPRNASIGAVAVRAAYVAPDASGTGKGYVVAAVVNNADTADTLTGVTSTAGTVAVAAPTPLPSRQLVSFGDPTVGASGTTLPITASSPLTVGTWISVTFVFEKAGSLVMRLPVQPTTGTTAASTPAPTGEATESATPTASATATP